MGITVSGIIEKGAPLFPSITSSNPGTIFALFEAVIDKFYLTWTNIPSLQQSLPQEFKGRISQRGTAYVFKGPVLIAPSDTSPIYLKITMAALLGGLAGFGLYKLLEKIAIGPKKSDSTEETSQPSLMKRKYRQVTAKVSSIVPKSLKSLSNAIFKKQPDSKNASYVIGAIATISGLAIASLAYASLNRVIPNKAGIHFFNWSDL